VFLRLQRDTIARHQFTIFAEEAQEYVRVLHPLAGVFASKKWE
jgi:hypothetical protein